MKSILIAFLILYMAAPSFTLFNFSEHSDISNWRIQDDMVMGGRSKGHFKINNQGYGEFSGNISLENNGGFSSVGYKTETLNVSEYSKAVIRIKGDGKNYQFRIKNRSSDYPTYVYEFETTKDWMTVIIPFKKMKPQFRGRKLDMPNYQGETIEEVIFLIGNKKEQSFRLLIDKIELD